MLVAHVQVTLLTTLIAQRMMVHAVCAAWDGNGLMITLQYHTLTGAQSNQQEDRYAGDLTKMTCGAIVAVTTSSDTFANGAEQLLEVSP